MNLTAPSDLPRHLAGRWQRVRERLAAIPEALLAEYPRAAETLPRVAICSDFALTTLLRHPEALLERLADSEPLSPERLAERFGVRGLSAAEAMTVLRQTRHVEMARLAWRDLAGWSDLDTNLADLSLLADGAIVAAHDYAQSQLLQRFGRPVDGGGTPVEMMILAMGKLGGGELNFSSDVDLVYLYPEGVVFEDRPRTRPDEYFRRLGQWLIKLLNEATADGTAFRVDTRLRPFGSSGPLAMSVSALENYLIRHGRDWERYAYQKARLITGRRHGAELFDEVLTPFVYRRYIDFGVFRSLRQMKALIADEVARRNLADNIKLGPGGIREIEFIVQVFQLVRGGQNPALRTCSLLPSLRRLEFTGVLESDAVKGLERAYRFLRTLENRLQAMEDHQTQRLPGDAESRAILAWAMGWPEWEELAAELEVHRQHVEAEFARLAFDERGEGRREGEASGRGADREASASEARGGSGAQQDERWAAAWERADMAGLLESSGVREAGAVADDLHGLRNSNLYGRMDEVSRQRLAEVVARLALRLREYRNPSWIVSRLVPLLRAICRRSAYLALIGENPGALTRLLTLAERSEFLVTLVEQHPLLLDELLDERIFDAAPTREELEDALERAVRQRVTDDVESQLEVMRAFQRGAVFRIAVADRMANLPLMKVSDRLTDTAELILAYALDMAYSELAERYGAPMCGTGKSRRRVGFAIVGYGKLGGIETGYGSDLDLIFLHDSRGDAQRTSGARPVENRVFLVRLVQRLISLLSIQTRYGRLYEVDMRLRPNGQSGALVSSMDSFRSYQRTQAWVWEHQALLRSRSVAGDAGVREAFENERREILIHHVNRRDLKAEVVKMRRRMRSELSRSHGGEFDIKQDAGGMADIEFLVQYWVLAHAAQYPDLVEYSDNVRQLKALARNGLVPGATADRIKSIYLNLRGSAHELALIGSGRVVSGDAFTEERAWIRDLWSEVLGA